MTCCTELYTGSIGIVFRVRFIDCDGNDVDVSTGSSFAIQFTPVDPMAGDEAFEVTAEAGDQPNEIKYTTEAGDFDLVGEWYCQGTVVIGGQTLKSTIVTFKVKRSL